jgi:hypothetical protein
MRPSAHPGCRRSHARAPEPENAPRSKVRHGHDHGKKRSRSLETQASRMPQLHAAQSDRFPMASHSNSSLSDQARGCAPCRIGLRHFPLDDAHHGPTAPFAGPNRGLHPPAEQLISGSPQAHALNRQLFNCCKKNHFAVAFCLRFMNLSAEFQSHL